MSLGLLDAGFVSCRDFVAADGENVSVIGFESLKTLAVWRNHPEHIVVQQRGRTEFFTEYRIQVCSLVQESAFKT